MADAPPPPKSEPATVSPIRTFAGDVARLTGKPPPEGRRRSKTYAPVLPTGAPPAHIIPKAPTTNETYEEVFLRTQKEAEADALLTPAARATPVPPIVPLPPKPDPAPLPKKDTESPIHTYKSDFSKQAASGGASRFSMVAAELDKKPYEAPVSLAEKQKNTTLFSVGAAFIVVGIVGVVVAYLIFSAQPVTPPEFSVPSLIFADEHIELSGSGEELRNLLSLEQGKQLADGDVGIVYMIFSTTTEAGTESTIATGGELFSALRLPAPNILLRNILPESTVGVVNAGGETRPFFILRVSSFERTFAGMLEWEATMERDLVSLYPPHPDPEVTKGTTSVAPFRLSFIDEVVDNHDVRVLRDAGNTIVMLYGYRDKETLIIARNTEAFSELLRRLASTRAR